MECIGIDTEHILLRGRIPKIKSSRKEFFIFYFISRIIFLLPSKGVFILYITYECPPCVKTRKHLTSITQRNIHWTHTNKCGVILVFANGEYTRIHSHKIRGSCRISAWIEHVRQIILLKCMISTLSKVDTLQYRIAIREGPLSVSASRDPVSLQDVCDPIE